MTRLVSVITPTWQRHDVLLSRCVPSVAAQTWPAVEHVIVSDGPDPDLAREMPAGVVYAELPEHDPAVRWGHHARLHGIEISGGELIAYLDDDDAYRPDHVATLARALESEPGAGFAWPRMIVHHPSGLLRLGDGAPAYGRIATSMIMHRRGVLKTSTWRDEPRLDWAVVERWLEAGIGYVSVDAETVDYYRVQPMEGTPACLPPWAPGQPAVSDLLGLRH